MEQWPILYIYMCVYSTFGALLNQSDICLCARNVFAEEGVSIEDALHEVQVNFFF